MKNNNKSTEFSRKYWFYVRKCIFQVFLPILLGLLTFSDFVNQSTKKTSSGSYNHLYFYTSFLLFIYAQISIILNFIFSICTVDIILKKIIDLQNSTPELIIASSTNLNNGHFMITIKKIFKLRFSNWKTFKFINELCWIIGIDSPVLIPYNVITRLTNHKSEIDSYNEQQLLDITLTNLLSYDPAKINGIPINTSNISPTGNEILTEYNAEKPLLPRIVISKLDQTIAEMQEKIFSKEMDVFSNV